LDLSKNIIVHFFVPRALVATALTALPPPTAPGETPAFGRFIVPRAILEERVQKLSRLFKFEFMFRADATFEQNFTETVEEMIRAGELQTAPSSELTFGEGHDGWTGRAWIRFYASIARTFLEGYRVAARSLAYVVKAPVGQKDL